MKKQYKLIFCILLFFTCFSLSSQTIIEKYQPKKNDIIRIGKGEKDFLPYIQKGYTLMFPDKKEVKGVLIFLEGSEFDKKNNSAKQIYDVASSSGFAVLSVSTEIPLDFYFTRSSLLYADKMIKSIFNDHKLPNKNIFFLGASLVGHRAMQYILFSQERKLDSQLNITGIVICNFTLDFTRKWLQHERDIELNRIDLWEPKFFNYILETQLKGTPKNVPENYHKVSSYSYFDNENRNIKHFKGYAIRAYIEPSIEYRLEKYYRTLYDNNTTDIVGFLAELRLAGNKNTELINLENHKQSAKKTSQSSWNKLDKVDLMKWILSNSKLD